MDERTYARKYVRMHVRTHVHFETGFIRWTLSQSRPNDNIWEAVEDKDIS